MKRGMRFTKGSGNNYLYLRVRDDGSYWNFSSLIWDVSESVNTKMFMTEYADTSDTVESFYSTTFTQPSGGPHIVEMVISSTGAVIGTGDTDTPIVSVSDTLSLIMTDVTDLIDERFGKWELDVVNKTMTLYRLDNTILAVFDLATTNASVKPYISRTPQ